MWWPSAQDADAYDEYIRPIQVLTDDLKADKRLLYDKAGGILPEHELIERASMFLDDSIHGREFKMHRNGKWPKRVHWLLNHEYVTPLFCMVALLWMGMVQLEPPSTLKDNDPATTTYPDIMLYITVEWCFFALFLVECLLRFYSYVACACGAR